MEESMVFKIVDISSGAITLALAAILIYLKMPQDIRWKAMRRMLSLLSLCYICMGVSNLITGLTGVSEAENAEMGIAVLLVSFFQALFFTATCLAFVAPSKVGVRWLTANVAAASSVCIVTIYALIRCKWAINYIWVIDILLYILQLVYYCILFYRSYAGCQKVLEDNYDDELSSGLRWIRNCFLGALTVGVSALLFAMFRMGDVMYLIFTSIYTLYYIYLVICVINYRIEAGYIVKVVTLDEVSQEIPDKSPDESHFDEQNLRDAIEKWVSDKLYVKNDQTVEEIAYELGTTHTVLKWYFTNRMHTTFRTWRISLRIQEAKRLMREEKVAASVVHKMVGVADKSNFHKQFRQVTGVTPKEYAERALGDE